MFKQIMNLNFITLLFIILSIFTKQSLQCGEIICKSYTGSTKQQKISLIENYCKCLNNGNINRFCESEFDFLDLEC